MHFKIIALCTSPQSLDCSFCPGSAEVQRREAAAPAGSLCQPLQRFWAAGDCVARKHVGFHDTLASSQVVHRDRCGEREQQKPSAARNFRQDLHRSMGRMLVMNAV